MYASPIESSFREEKIALIAPGCLRTKVKAERSVEVHVVLSQNNTLMFSKNSLARGKYQRGNAAEAKANGLKKWWEIYRYSVRAIK
jgi:hypothetical protein